MFHIADSSWRGAATATAQMVATVVALFAFSGRVEPVWIPFGSLAVGYAVSGVVAWLLTAPLLRVTDEWEAHPEWHELSRIGRWLLLANLAVFGGDFVLAVIVKAALGPEVLGYAEGARVVARPVIILGLGLAAVLGPRSVRAGMAVDLAAARSSRRIFWALSLLGGLLYLPLVGFHWALNPLTTVLPTAYEVDGLVAVTVIGAIVLNHALPFWYELLGGRRQRDLARSEGIASALKVATGLLASLLQAFTLPIAWGLAFVARGIGLDVYARRLFRDGMGPTGKPPEVSARRDG
jgi:O-antigen/teichoic acid export membrane protein